MKLARGLMALFLTLPMWLYLLHEILVRVDADRLMWFLYWAYVPFNILVGVITAMVDAAAIEKR